MAKIVVVNARGEKQSIPEHWLKHPKLGKDFRLPPSAKAKAEKPAEAEPGTKA